MLYDCVKNLHRSRFWRFLLPEEIRGSPRVGCDYATFSPLLPRREAAQNKRACHKTEELFDL